MSRRFLQTIAIVAGLAGLAFTVNAQTTTGWTLVWADEFSQPDGTSPDPVKWVFDLGGNGWGNNELETYTSRTNNVRIEGGQLIIEARQESFTGTDGIPRNYTSARLKTKTKASWTYGRMEARIKIPRGQGLWPAFWTLGTNIDAVNWPTCGEIDIMENIGAEPSIVHGTAHGPGYSGANGIGAPYSLSGAAFADDFHVFAMEWETNRLRWYVDGQLYFTVTPANLPGGATWVFTQPQFLLLNVAVGGNWPGSPNGSTTFPQRMTVDYVRVYAPSTIPACGGNALPNPGFESGLANWTPYGTAVIENIAHVPVHSGTNVFKVYGQFNGGTNYSGVYHDVALTPGTVCSADGWALTPANDRIAGTNAAWLEISFRDAAAQELARYRSAMITSNTAPGVWLDLPVTNQVDPATAAVIGTVTSLVAPPATSFARVQTVFRQPALAAGSVLFDDLNFFVNAADEFPATVSLTTSGGGVAISFPTYLGWQYEVRCKNALDDSTWQVLTNITGDGVIHQFTESPAAESRFYQVVRVCF